jgi:hypothetical protein
LGGFDGQEQHYPSYESDGNVFKVVADPGEGVMIYFPPVITQQPVLLR